VTSQVLLGHFWLFGVIFGLFIYLWHIAVDFGQKFCQMFWVIVAENVLRNSAVSDSLDHGGVVARVRKNFATWEKNLEESASSFCHQWPGVYKQH
jgi:hypothetical protein